MGVFCVECEVGELAPEFTRDLDKERIWVRAGGAPIS